jgi:flagellar protein FliJ
LQPILELRARHLESVQQRFAQQQQRVLALQSKIDETQHILTSQFKPQQQEADPVLRNQQFRYVQYLKQQIQYLMESKQQELRLLEVIRSEMKTAHIEKKTLDTLKDKQKETFHRESQAREMLEIEEIVAARLNRF